MLHLKHQPRTKLSSLSNHRMTPESPPSLYFKHRGKDEKRPHAGNCILPYIDHQIRAKSSLDYKSYSKANVLPTLCPEHGTRTIALSLPTPARHATAPFSSNHLDDSLLHPVQWTKALLGPEYFPKNPLASECQMHLPYLNQKPTLLPVTEVPHWPYPWGRTTATILPCPGSQAKALLHSKNEIGTTTSLSQSFSHHHKAILTPLPSLNQRPKAKAVILSELIPSVQVSPSKLHQSNIYPKVTTSLQCPDLHSMVKPGSSLQTNHSSTVTAICPPHPKYWNNFTSSECLRVTAIARASSGPNFLIKSKTLPSGIAGLSLPKGEVTLPCNNHVPEASLTSCYKSKTTSRSPLYPNVQDILPSHADRCTLAQVPSGLKRQVTNSPETAPWEKALPYIKCDITKVPVSNSQAKLAPQGISHKDESAMVWATSDLSFMILSDIDHPSEFSLESDHQDIPPLVPSICANVPLIPCRESTKTVSQDYRSEVELSPGAQKPSLLSPKHQEEAVLDPIFRPISLMSSYYPAIPSLGLDHQMIAPPTPIHQILYEPDSCHQTTVISSPDHHANDILDSNIQGTLKSADNHWEPVPLRPVQQDNLQPSICHQAKSTGDSSPQVTLQVFPFHCETKARTNKESQENEVAPLLDKDLHVDSIEESNNVRSRPVTALEHHKIPIQGLSLWPIPESHPRPEALTDCNSLANASLSTNHQHEAQSTNQHKVQTLQNTEATWYFNHIKPYTIEGKVVIPTITVKDIISSIPQEKIKKDIHKQVLLRRMKGATHRPGRRILSSYRVCLACASWIPNGCPHMQGTKYPGQVQLLAIPMPLPGSEVEMGMKFILQIPQAKKCSIFNITPTFCTLRPSCVSPP
ncbi:uncharacterized protein LOC118836002 [Trichosurus vulpecula]|uniref:uncharacterized protein LOC118836002 n=1 Tax=Trichosurus vulpecula TaxID=9337 RepID=UPI00186B22D3|nr:uncharacterized protein LOC118836002 [Trichosurus vulpecula]